MFRNDDDTICAISTATGKGAIAIVKISGKDSLFISHSLCPFLNVQKIKPQQVYYGFLKDPKNKNTVDEVLVTYFKKDKSFTTEPLVEISCHGGQQSSYKILNLLIQQGARLADPGEFTYRAFLNGRIDLMQAEGILSLIESQNQTMANLSLRQIEGQGSLALKNIENKLIKILAQIEANIDFSFEELEVSSIYELLTQTKNIYQELQILLDSYSKACLFKEGLQIALAGKPNVGKSSLFNAFLKKDRAIVATEAGTTRDFLEEAINIEGLPVTFIDTAGLRNSANFIEQEGIKKAKTKIQKANFVFCLFDASKNITAIEVKDLLKNLDLHTLDSCLFIANKIDLNKSFDIKAFIEVINQGLDLLNIKILINKKCFLISAKNSESLLELNCFLSQFIKSNKELESAVIVQARHFGLLQTALNSTKKTLDLFETKEPLEFIAFELQEALLSIYKILGKNFDDQILDQVFKEFCLGK